MVFHDVRLPETVERGAVGGPRFKTTIVPLASGHERRNIDWQRQRGAWDIGYGIDDKGDFALVADFFYARYGRAHGFRYKDWTDFELARQVIGATDGATAAYQVYKRYSSGGFAYDRQLHKLVSGTVLVWVNDVAIAEGGGDGQYQVDLTTGTVTLGATLAAQSGTDVEVSCEFDVPVRFDTDELDISAVHFDAGTIPNLPIIEIRL